LNFVANFVEALLLSSYTLSHAATVASEGRAAKAAEDCAHSKTLREYCSRTNLRQVLECAQSSAAFGNLQLATCN